MSERSPQLDESTRDAAGRPGLVETRCAEQPDAAQTTAAAASDQSAVGAVTAMASAGTGSATVAAAARAAVGRALSSDVGLLEELQIAEKEFGGQSELAAFFSMGMDGFLKENYHIARAMLEATSSETAKRPNECLHSAVLAALSLTHLRLGKFDASLEVAKRASSTVAMFEMSRRKLELHAYLDALVARCLIASGNFGGARERAASALDAAQATGQFIATAERSQCLVDELEKLWEALALPRLPPVGDSMQDLMRLRENQLLRDNKGRIPDSPDSRTLQDLAFAAELRDDPSGMHGARVGVLVELLARRLKYEAEMALALGKAAETHDVGKSAIADEVLLKDGPLNSAERHQMQRHTEIGADLVGAACDAPYVTMAIDIAHRHHERWDGTGYPSGHAGVFIAPEVRMTSLADAFDTMVHRRSYRDARSVDEALDEIQAGLGSQFDPTMGREFIALIRALEGEHGDPIAYISEVASRSSLAQARRRVDGG